MNDDSSHSDRPRLLQRYHAWLESLSETNRDLLRLALIVAGLGLLGGATYYFAGPKWRDWRHRQALRQAVEHAEREDYRGSLLALKRATDLAPLDLATWREVAERLAQLGSPQSVLAHENLVRLAPGDVSLRLALVEQALRFRESGIADAALRELDETARADANFHRLAAALAMATGENAAMEEHLANLVAADPDDSLARFNLAALRLWSLDEATQAAALRELEQLTETPSVRVRAGLELLKHAARVRDADRARAVVDLLLVRLDAAPVVETKNDDAPRGWKELLQALQSDAARSGATEVELVARWMSDVRLRRDALAWIDSLPEALRDASAVRRAATTLAAELDDYPRLATLLHTGALGPLPDDAVLLALASRLQRKRYQDTHGRSTWEDAIAACRGDLSALGALATLAELWRDPAGNEQVLSTILERSPLATWAYEALRNNYLARGETTKLWQLHEKWLRVAPANSAVARGWLSLGLVLGRVSPESAALAEARATSPGADAIDHCLSAATAWRQKDLATAVQRLEAVPETKRQRADIAFWVTVILADTTEPELREQARQALAFARRPGLSAEETTLLERAAGNLR